jgi:hypothetical protein
MSKRDIDRNQMGKIMQKVEEQAQSEESKRRRRKYLFGANAPEIN